LGVPSDISFGSSATILNTLYTRSARFARRSRTISFAWAGRKRLDASSEFAATLHSQVPHPTFNDAEAEANSEFVERLDDDGMHTGLIVIAPHGGDIERHTDQQAERVASRLKAKTVSSWRCKGFKEGGGASDRWHITSIDIHEARFPRLNSVIPRGFTYAVAFHGFDEPTTDVLIGGGAPGSLKREIKTVIKGALAGSGMRVRIASAEEGLAGIAPRTSSTASPPAARMASR